MDYTFVLARLGLLSALLGCQVSLYSMHIHMGAMAANLLIAIANTGVLSV